MAKIRRVDFSPDEWLAGTRELTLEERGAYWDVCALMYSRGGPIPDDRKWLRQVLGADRVRTVHRLIERLVAIGKLKRLEPDAASGAFHRLMNDRVSQEIVRSRHRIGGLNNQGPSHSRTTAEPQRSHDGATTEPRRSQRARRVSKQINELPSACEGNHQPSTINHVRDTESGLEAAATGSARDSYAETDEAHRRWLPVATALGIPDPGFLNSERRSALAARLAEIGGLEGWTQALERLREAEFLRDDRDPSKPKRWVNLFTICKPENFTGLMEGRYAERRHRQGTREGEDHAGGSATSAGIDAALARRSLQPG